MSNLISEICEETDIQVHRESEDESFESEIKNIQAEEDSKKLEVAHSDEQKESKPSTSSALMYSEYMNTNESERVTRIFERKTKKPVILSYGESPLYKKYSELLKRLEESPEEYPGGWGKKFPIIKVHLLLKRKYDSDSDEENDDIDTEDNRIIICKKENCDDSSDSSSDEEQSITAKPPVKIEVLDETENSKNVNENNSEMNISSKHVDTEDNRIIICKKEKNCDDSSSDSSSDEEQSITAKSPVKIEVLDESENSKNVNENNSEMNISSKHEIDTTVLCDFKDACLDSDDGEEEEISITDKSTVKIEVLDESESSNDDEEQPITAKPLVKIEVLDESENFNDVDESNSKMNIPVSKHELGSAESCDFRDTCLNSDLAGINSNYDHVAKKQRID